MRYLLLQYGAGVGSLDVCFLWNSHVGYLTDELDQLSKGRKRKKTLAWMKDSSCNGGNQLILL